MEGLKKALTLGIIILLPFIVLIGAANLCVRMPDFYQYEFNSGNISKNLGISGGDVEMAAVFSLFMSGRSEELVLEAGNSDEERENVLDIEEQIAAKHFRSVLNGFTMVAAFALLIVVAGYYIFIQSGEKESLRRVFLFSLPVLIVYEGVLLLIWMIPAVWEFCQTFMIGIPLPEMGVLFQICTKQFILHLILAIGAIAMIVYLILGMVTWNLTRPYRMFGPHR